MTDAIPTIQRTLLEETPKIAVPEIREKYEFLTKLSQVPWFHPIWDELLKMDTRISLEQVLKDLSGEDE